MFNGFYLTYKGQEYIAKSLTGKTLAITRGQFGNGSIGSGIPNERTSLVSALGDLIISKKAVSENRLTITTQFSNKVNGSILPAFYLTEAGIYGKVLNADGTTDSAETLIAYAYCNQSEADEIKQVLTEFILNWPMVISSEANVEVTIDESLAYPTLEEYNKNNLIQRTGTVEVLRGTNSVVSDLSEENGMVELSIYGKSVQDGTPTPDSPIDIVSVENPEILVCGGNLIPYPYNGLDNNDDEEVTWTVNEDTSISVSGSPTKQRYYAVVLQYQLSKGTYTLSGCPKGGQYQKYWMYVERKSDGYVWYEVGNGVTFEVETDGKYDIAVNVGVNAGTLSNLTFKPILTKGAEIRPFEPYKEQTLSIPHTLRGIPVSSGGNYTDADGQQWVCDEIDLEKRRFIQRIGIAVIDGSKAFAKNNAIDYDDNFVYFANKQTLGIDTVRHEGYCTHLPCVSNTSGGICAYMSSIPHVLYVDAKLLLNGDSSLNVSSNVNSALAENPMTLYYVLAEPIEFPLTADYLKTHYPVTSIFVTDGIDVDFEAKIRTRSYANKFPFETVGIDTVTSDDINYGGLHKVSDKVPTLEQLQKGGKVSFNEGGNGIITMNYPEGEMTVMTLGSTNGAGIVFNGLTLAAVAFEDGAKVLGNTLDEKGVYFAQNDMVITHSLTINGYTGFKSPNMRPIPLEYMPKEVLTEITGVTRAEFDALDAQVTYTAMMTDTLSEEV